MFAFKPSAFFYAVCAMAMVTLPTASGMDCTDAVSIGSLPFEVNGNNNVAAGKTGIDFDTPSDNLRNLTCGVPPSVSGVWYRIEPQASGTFLKAVVSDAPGPADTKFNAALFKGSSCEDMGCMQAREFSMENQRTEPTMTWFAHPDEAYYLYIFGVNTNEQGGFKLNVEAFDLERPTNDKCELAEPLAVGGGASSDSTGAQPHGLENALCSLHPNSRGTFYEVLGTGLPITVTFLSEMPSEMTMEVAVLTGDECQTCVTFSDFLTTEDTPHTIQFLSEVNQTYTVVVAGESFEDAGIFAIELEEGEMITPPGDIELDELEASGASSSMMGLTAFAVSILALFI